MTTGLGIAAQPAGRGLVVRVTGILGDGEGAHASLREVVSALPPPEVAVFDLRAVQLLTVAGVGELLTVAQTLGARGVRCGVVVDAGGAVGSVLRAAVSPSDLDVFDAVDEALTGESRPPVAKSPAGLAETDLDELAVRFTSLTQLLVKDTTVDATLRRVVDAARSIVPGADLVSVTLRDRTGVFFTPVETSAVAGALDRVQYRTGQGPCLDAARPDGPAYASSDDLATEVRWPCFARAATGHGVAAVLSTDLHTHGPAAVGGALNIYSTKARGLDDHDRHAALLLATHASLALAYTTATEQAVLHNRNLHRASESRDVIGQAKGILMARQGMTADEAFEVLSRTSQHLNMKLVDLARTLAHHPDSLDTPVRPRR